MKPRKSFVPGVYVMKEIPELGMHTGDYLTIERPGTKNPYMMMRILTRSVAEMIVATDGCLLLREDGRSSGAGHPTVRTGRPHLELVR